MSKLEKIFDKQTNDLIVEAITHAEKRTSAEIRVYIESRCHGNVLDRAAEIFARLEMHKTAARNGVLIYLATSDHKTAILGDVAINDKVSPDFWDTCYKAMSEAFRHGEFARGITEAITLSEEVLAKNFPYRSDDVNELPDEICFGK